MGFSSALKVFNVITAFARTAGPHTRTLSKAKALRRALLAHLLAYSGIVASYGAAVP